MSQPLLITAQPASNWTAQNPILPQFTIGRESDTGKEKLGNGVTAWADLNYSNPSGAVSAGDITTAVNAAVAALLDGAPGALDTLNELAAALADDAAFSTTVANALATIPVKASGAEVDTGTDDAKFVTAKAVEDSDYVKASNLPTILSLDNSDAEYLSTDKNFAANYLIATGNGIYAGDPEAPTSMLEVSGTRLRIGGGGDGLSNVSINLGLLPATDPVDAGQLWNDNGTLKISAG